MKVTAGIGELQSHRQLLTRLIAAAENREFDLMILFPTIDLLNTIQEELLRRSEIAGVGGYRLLLFEGFISELREGFGLNTRVPGTLERDLLLRQVLAELETTGSFNYLNRIDFTFNYRQALLDGIAEWKRAGLGPDLFREWASDQGEKARELALLYGVYQEKLVAYGFVENDLTLDEFQFLQLEGFQKNPLSPVLLYGFNDLTPLQLDFIQALTLWFDFEAIVDPTGVPEFQNLTRRFFPYVKIDDHGRVSDGETALGQLQRFLWREVPHPLPIDSDDLSLRMIQAAGSGLAVAIAREIRRLLQEPSGYDLGDILIVSPQPESFINQYEMIFQRYQLNLPHPGLEAGKTALYGQFRQMLQALLEDWQWPEMKILLQQYYRGALAKAGDRFSAWMVKHYGAVSGKVRWLKWLGDSDVLRKAKENGIDLAPLETGIKWLLLFPETACLGDYLHLTYQWFQSQIEMTPEDAVPEDYIGRAKLRNHQAAHKIMAAIDNLFTMDVRLTAINRRLTLAEFKAWAEDYLAMDQKITDEVYGREILRVLSPREIRGISAGIVFVTGLEQGVFPRVYINDWKLDAKARWDWKLLGIELEQGETHQLQERLAFYWSVQAATDRLYLVYQDQDADGQIANRSGFLNEVLRWFPQLEATMIWHALEPTVCAGFLHCRAEHEFRQLWVAYSARPKNELPAGDRDSYQRLASEEEYECVAAGIHYLMGGNLPGLDIAANPTPYLRQWLAERFGKGVALGVTACEDYQICPYRFFLKYMLKIRPLPTESLLPEAIDLGQFYHQVLADFCEHYRSQPICQEKLNEYQDFLELLIKGQLEAWQAAAANDQVRAALVAAEEQIRKTFRRWLMKEVEWAKLTNNRFRLHATELEFGEEAATGGIGGLYLTEGQLQMVISGRIDRIDRDEAGHFIVYDYKLGRGPSASDIMEVKRLQLPVYILALEQGVFGIAKGLGGAYLGLRAPSRNGSGVWRKERLNIVWRSKNELNEAEWEEWLERVRTVLITIGHSISRGEFRLTPETCPEYCEYKACCRRREWEVEGRGVRAQ